MYIVYKIYVNIIGTGDLWTRMSLLLSLFYYAMGDRECKKNTQLHHSRIHCTMTTTATSTIYVVAVWSFMSHTN